MSEKNYEIKILEINNEICISKVFESGKIITCITFNSKKEYEVFNYLYLMAKDDYFKNQDSK
jgi:hypothetical protein